MATPRRKSVHKSSVHSKADSLSPLELLKKELRHDAGLLEDIPLHSIFLVKNCLMSCGIDGYMSDGIKIGTIENGGDSWQLYALMSVKLRNASGLPEVAVFGAHPDPFSTAYERYPVEIVLDKGQLREEFQILKGYDINALAVVIKTCFILKGVGLPSNFSFTPRFIKAVPKVCRRYRDGPSKVMSSPVPASEVDSSPPRVASRKSGSRRPSYQHYDALGSLPSHTATPNTTRDTIKVSTGPVPRARSTESADDRRTSSICASETPCYRPKKKGISTIIKKVIAEAVNRHPIYQLIGGQPHGLNTLFLNNESGVKPPGSFQQAYTPVVDPRLRLGKSTTPAPSPAPFIAPWPTQLPTFSQPIPTAPASLRALEEVLELNTKTKELQDEVAEIQGNISKTDQRYHQKKVKATQKIDVDLAKRHRQELRDLQIKQKKESDDLKEQHAQLKKNEEQDMARLVQQKKDKLAEMEAVRHDMDKKCEELSKEQLLDFFLAQYGGKKRKREDSLGGEQM